MFKKILPFLCSLAPLYAFGAEVIIETNPNDITLGNDQYANILSSGVPSVNVNVGSGGINIENLSVLTVPQAPASTNGDLYIINTSENPFGIVSNGNITIRNNINVSGETAGLQLSGPVVMNVGGNIVADGLLDISGATSFTSGAITSGNMLSINAGQITTGLISSSDGNTTVAATGALDIGGIVANRALDATVDPTTVIGGATIKSGNIQNLYGNMTLTSGGFLTSSGNVENSGTMLTVNATGNMTVSGTVKNDSSTGALNITANGLTVSGSDAVNNSSFVNAGNAVFNIAGDMMLAHGMNLTNMTDANSLRITAGTLNLGTNNIIANAGSYINIDATNGAFNAGTISNGTDGGTGNASAQMILKGVGVNAASVQNYGNSLTISTYDTSANNNITISGGLLGASGTNTNIAAADLLDIDGDVVNSGDMTLGGGSVNLAGITNSGSSLNISASTDNGVMRIDGALTNSNGTTTVISKDLKLSTVVNNSGTLNITASDTAGGALEIGPVAVNGGAMNLNALVGGVAMDSVDVLAGGLLNIGNGVHNINSTGAINIAGNVNLNDAATTGNGDVYLTSNNTSITSGENITIGGNIIAMAATGRAATIDGVGISVNGDTGVNVSGNGNSLTFGSDNGSSELTVANALSATNDGIIEIYSGASSAKSLTESDGGAFIMHGNSFTATGGTINISDGVSFGASVPTDLAGMIINGNISSFDLVAQNGAITISNGINVASGKTLNVNTISDSLTINGTSALMGRLTLNASDEIDVNNDIALNDESSSLSAVASTVNVKGVQNSGNVVLTATTGAGTIQSGGAITNSGGFFATAKNVITLGDFESTAGVVEITSNASDISAGNLTISGGTASINGVNTGFSEMNLTGGTTAISASSIGVDDGVLLSGNLVQGGMDEDVGVLKLTGVTDFSASSLSISNGNFVAKSGNTKYLISGEANLGNSINISNSAMANISAGTILGKNISNSGTLYLASTNDAAGMSFATIENNSVLNLTTNGLLSAESFKNNQDAVATVSSANMTVDGMTDIDGILYQGAGSSGALNITNNNYVITTGGMAVDAINQSDSYKMVINTSDLTVGGNIVANDLTIAANPVGNWANVAVGGSVIGNAKFVGLEHMTVAGNYMYGNGSSLHAAVLPFATGTDEINSTPYNYWADVSLAEDSTLGRITNHDNNPENALIYINGKFSDNLSIVGPALDGSALVVPEIGINLYDTVDQGSAIWLLYAKEGITDLAIRMRNLKVNFCNADGSVCFNYFDAFDTSMKPITNAGNNGTEDDLPIYLSLRDYDDDGINDSLYIVFDPRFGGPVNVFDIEPIVRHADNTSDGEVSAANSLDKMVAGQLNNRGFYNDTPIEVIPMVFNGTNLSGLATELYNRMERYLIDRDGTALANLSRLTQPRELEQVMASVALNEHTEFRDFEDHMFDEFIWNRNRNLNKVWADADFGMLRQNASDSKVVSGNRFNFTAGFDWQSSQKSIWGVMAHLTHMSSNNSDDVELGYMPDESISGHNSMRVSDTNVGIGGYWLHTLGTSARVYGNAMLDLHLFDLSREQNYVDSIKGSGSAFSLMSEWGLLHDWLNQYIVGNLYARVGYNFGFSITEKTPSADYMHLKSDGYFSFTPGYSLIAQKRIYPSAWFQIRPYASIGIEYDVLGMPSATKFKFAPAASYSEYNMNMNPLWANIGGGFEMLAANGIQVGLDYRYQYNQNIQLHNIRLSGSYRF